MLTRESAERYLSRKRVRDRTKRKHQVGISNHQVNVIRNNLERHGFITNGPEVVEIQSEWLRRGRCEISSNILLEISRGRAEDLSDDKKKILIITDADIYARASKSVKILEDRDGGVVIVSTMRIRSGVQWRFLARLLSLIMHGLGHTLGLKHCRNVDCVMYSSKRSRDIEMKFQAFCDKCRKQAGDALVVEENESDGS